MVTAIAINEVLFMITPNFSLQDHQRVKVVVTNIPNKNATKLANISPCVSDRTGKQKLYPFGTAVHLNCEATVATPHMIAVLTRVNQLNVEPLGLTKP